MSKGKYGVDPHGVQFVSFEMPYEPEETEITFEYEIPGSKEPCTATVTNSKGILGIIVLFEPNAE